MEKMSINIKDLSSIINLLIEKIQVLDSKIFSKQQKLVFTTEILEVVENLREFFVKAIDSVNSECKQGFVEKIERAFSQFEWNTSVAITPSEFKKFSENGKLLISSLLKLLGSKGCGLLIIETYLKLCLKTVTEINEVDNKNQSKANFRLLLEGFSSAAKMLKKYWHIAFSFEQKNTIMLCLDQICKLMPYLLRVIEFQNLYLKTYLINLLKKCLTKMQSEIHNNENLKSKSCQNFIMMMNFCLCKLNDLSNSTNDFPSFIKRASTTVTVLKPVIDELLCSVMSVAQVTDFEEDNFAILTTSQKVLREFGELEREIEDENSCAIRLIAGGLGETLCSLEQKVNNAVLKLVLEVFSNVHSPLKNILNKCKMNITKDNKASEDLNVLITDFDSEMDKIMQIGLFTISCTTSLNRKLGIQSCLASLESLETELILSLTTLYVDCNSKNKTNFQWLFDFWLNEISKLKVLIDSVLDPAGFCGVVKTHIISLRMAFKEDTSSVISTNSLSSNLKKTVRYSKKLIKTLRTNMEDEKDINKITEEYLLKFQLAVQECEAVLNLIDEGQDAKKIINQAVKRYDFLMQTLENLSSYLFHLVTDEESKYNEKEIFSDETSFPNIYIPQKNYYKLYEDSDSAVTPSKTIPEILTPYVNKGILRSKSRNVLYTVTAQANKNENENDLNKFLSQSSYWEKTPSSNQRSRCCKPLPMNLELENTIDLEITNIFENISELRDTFHRTSQGSAEVETNIKKNEKGGGKDVVCSTENDAESLTPTYKSSGCCTQLDFDANINSDTENLEFEKSCLGFQLQNRFLQALNDISCSESLLLAKNEESSSYVSFPDRMNDLKIVEEKINFLKSRMPLEQQ